MAVIARTMLVMNRQTKGAVLYDNKNGGSGQPNALITSIYLRKEGFPTGNYPATIHVSIETEEDIGS